MKIRAILETETMDPDFREPFLNGMPFDITESTFDRIVRYASGCTDVQQPTKTLRKMKLKITTLVIVEEGQVQDIYHSLNDNQDKAYEEIIDQVNAEYGDGGVLQFYSLQGIKEYFEIVHIQTQELTSIGFKTAILDL